MVYSSKYFASPQEQLAHDVYGLSDKDAEALLVIVDSLFDDSDEEPLTDEEIVAIDEANEHKNDPDYWTSSEEVHRELEACE